MSWMAWTSQTAAFFAGIGFALAVMTVWEILSPTKTTRGFLPMPTTRGDRFFIGLLSAAFIHLLWLGVVADNILGASALSAIWLAALLRWG